MISGIAGRTALLGALVAVLLVVSAALAPPATQARQPSPGGALSVPEAGPRELPADRVLVLFLPAPGRAGGPGALVGALAERPELSLGLVSPSNGAYLPLQTLLDVSQGTRVATRLYREPLPALALRPEGRGGTIGGWAEAVERAREAPGSLVPGLLAEEAARRGRIAYVGPAGARNAEAVVAADRAGRIPRVVLVPEPELAAAVRREAPEAALTVARLPGTAAGREALSAILDGRRPDELVVVVESPPEGELAPLAIAAVGPGMRRPGAGAGAPAAATLRSETTRRSGLVAATDLAPTVLGALGLAVPAAVEGREISAAGRRDADALVAQAARLEAVNERRGPVPALVVAGWLVAAAALALVARRPRPAGRLLLLALLWLPALALLTAALAPPALGEGLVLGLGALALAALADRLLPWPVAPVLPAGVSFLAHAVDLALGSALTGLSLLGPGPLTGARFFGIGNELEALLGVSVLLGAGAYAARRSRAVALAAFALSGLVGAAVLGSGRLGADVGAVITLAAGVAGAALFLAPPARRRRLAPLVVLGPLAALGALALADLALGGGAHLSRSVLDAEGPDALLDVAERRLRLSLGALAAPGLAALVALALAVMALGIRRRDRILAALASAPGFAAGIAAGLAATVLGALGNDSGPTILLIGTGVLLLAVLYAFAGAPRPRAPATGAGGAVRARVPPRSPNGEAKAATPSGGAL